jgi:hypothetical protein
MYYIPHLHHQLVKQNALLVAAKVDRQSLMEQMSDFFGKVDALSTQVQELRAGYSSDGNRKQRDLTDVA